MERLEDLAVLRAVKKLWGPMDDYFMQAHGGLFLFSGAIDGLPEEEFPEHFGMTKQDFEDEYGDKPFPVFRTGRHRTAQYSDFLKGNRQCAAKK